MESLLGIVLQVTGILGLVLNANKCKVVADSCGSRISSKINDVIPEQFPNSLYLGVIFSKKDFFYQKNLELRLSKGEAVIGVVKGILKGGYNRYEIESILFSAQIRPVLEYGSDAFHVSWYQLEQLDRMQLDFGKACPWSI